MGFYLDLIDMEMNSQQQLLTLLRAGLGNGTVDAAQFGNSTDWDAIYRMARQQTVAGIVFDGLKQLPPALMPPRGIYLKWCNAILRLEEDNRKLDQEIANLYTLFRMHGLEPILMKGQAVAQNYPDPLHRQCGDIDLYTGPAAFEWGNKLLRREATNEHEERHKHTSMGWHGVLVENHRVMANLSTPWRDARLQKDISSLSNPLAPAETAEIGGTEATILPPAFNTSYLLVHALTHFLNEGIGLRHLCDWACHVAKHCSPEEKDEAARLLRRYGLQRPARAFGALAVQQLGFPAEVLPFPFTGKDVKNARFLLDEIWEGGNFGHYDGRISRRPEGRWQGKWYTFTRAVRRCMRVWRLAPAEAACYPMALAWHTATNLLRTSRR